MLMQGIIHALIVVSFVVPASAKTADCLTALSKKEFAELVAKNARFDFLNEFSERRQRIISQIETIREREFNRESENGVPYYQRRYNSDTKDATDIRLEKVASLLEGFSFPFLVADLAKSLLSNSAFWARKSSDSIIRSAMYGVFAFDVRRSDHLRRLINDFNRNENLMLTKDEKDRLFDDAFSEMTRLEFRRDPQYGVLNLRSRTDQSTSLDLHFVAQFIDTLSPIQITRLASVTSSDEAAAIGTIDEYTAPYFLQDSPQFSKEKIKNALMQLASTGAISVEQALELTLILTGPFSDFPAEHVLVTYLWLNR